MFKKIIINITDEVPSDIVLLIVNALYFKASWVVLFEEMSVPQPFTLSNGDQITTQMMYRNSHQNRAAIINLDKIGKFTALAVPYEVQCHPYLMATCYFVWNIH